ncbi:MAG: hypothetical protein GY733_01930, partial [bacterium]|nr:hypothetical protein [bacterium]
MRSYSRIAGALFALSAALPTWAQTAPFVRPSVAAIVNGTQITDDERIKLPRKYHVKKGREARYWKGLFRERIIVKFHDGPRIRAANPQDRSLYQVPPTSAGFCFQQLTSGAAVRSCRTQVRRLARCSSAGWPRAGH